jgi:hypothetical protein
MTGGTMAALFVTGQRELLAVGVGTMLVIATAMAGSLTVLPALLSKLGDRVDRGCIPFLGFRREARDSRVFTAVVDNVLRRPVASLAVAGGLLVALAIPAFWLHTNNTDQTALPQGSAIRRRTSGCSAPSRATRSPRTSCSREPTSARARSGTRSRTYAAARSRPARCMTRSRAG